MKRQVWIVASAIAIAGLCAPVYAQEAGDWLFRAGAYAVSPKSDNTAIADVEDGYSLGFNGTYFVTERFAVELLASLPFTHDIELKADGSKVGEVKHLPPTLSAQYHFPVSDSVRMYAGAGVNWTLFFEEDTTGALDGTKLELDDSVGLALQLGADFNVNNRIFINAEARYIDIESDAELDGVEFATVEIDPWVFGLNLGWRF